jgi:hypothetical protein
VFLQNLPKPRRHQTHIHTRADAILRSYNGIFFTRDRRRLDDSSSPRSSDRHFKPSFEANLGDGEPKTSKIYVNLPACTKHIFLFSKNATPHFLSLKQEA